MAIASLAASGFGAGAQTAGSFFAAKSAKSSAEHRARMARINAKLAESDARASLARGERAEQAARMDTAQMKSAQRVGMAANGVDLTSETAAAVLTSTDYLGEVDANTIKANALREAWGHRIQATGMRGQAGMYAAEAKGISPGMDAFGTLLTGASQVASGFSSMEQSGALARSEKTWEKRMGGFMDGLKGF